MEPDRRVMAVCYGPGSPPTTAAMLDPAGNLVDFLHCPQFRRVHAGCSCVLLRPSSAARSQGGGPCCRPSAGHAWTPHNLRTTRPPSPCPCPATARSPSARRCRACTACLLTPPTPAPTPAPAPAPRHNSGLIPKRKALPGLVYSMFDDPKKGKDAARLRAFIEVGAPRRSDGWLAGWLGVLSEQGQGRRAAARLRRGARGRPSACVPLLLPRHTPADAQTERVARRHASPPPARSRPRTHHRPHAVVIGASSLTATSAAAPCCPALHRGAPQDHRPHAIVIGASSPEAKTLEADLRAILEEILLSNPRFNIGAPAGRALARVARFLGVRRLAAVAAGQGDAALQPAL